MQQIIKMQLEDWMRLSIIVFLQNYGELDGSVSMPR